MYLSRDLSACVCNCNALLNDILDNIHSIQLHIAGSRDLHGPGGPRAGPGLDIKSRSRAGPGRAWCVTGRAGPPDPARTDYSNNSMSSITQQRFYKSIIC